MEDEAWGVKLEKWALDVGIDRIVDFGIPFGARSEMKCVGVIRIQKVRAGNVEETVIYLVGFVLILSQKSELYHQLRAC